MSNVTKSVQSNSKTNVSLTTYLNLKLNFLLHINKTDEEEISNENDRKIKITLRKRTINRQRKSPKVIRYFRYNRKIDSFFFFSGTITTVLSLEE